MRGDFFWRIAEKIAGLILPSFNHNSPPTRAHNQTSTNSIADTHSRNQHAQPEHSTISTTTSFAPLSFSEDALVLLLVVDKARAAKSPCIASAVVSVDAPDAGACMGVHAAFLFAKNIRKPSTFNHPLSHASLPPPPRPRSPPSRRPTAPAGRTAASAAGCCCSTSGRATAATASASASVVAAATRAHFRPAVAPPTQNTWSRPTPDRDQDWIKPSYVPGPRTQPDFPTFRPDEPRPLYAPAAPEFSPAKERPESPAFSPKEMPKMPERPRDPIPAGNPGGKERPPGEGESESAPQREEPAAPRPPPVKKGT